MTPPLYVLAGGRSSRFGSDKARALLHGRPLMMNLVATMSPAVSSVTVIADTADKYADLGVVTIGDDEPRRGPLGGLVTALRHRKTTVGPGWLLLGACDLVIPSAEDLSPLLSHAHEPFLAVLFESDRLEPLFALYHTDLLPAASQRCARGDLAMHRLVRASPNRIVRRTRPITQVNAAEDLHRLESPA